MKIAVTAKGETADSQVDPRFGRAAKFVLVDTQTSEVTAVDNDQGVSASQGAGVQATDALSRLGAELVITGHCGPKAFRALEAAGIKVVVGAAGRVSEVLDQFMAGELRPASAAEAEGHRA
jgi:predicted Fe-Mo cluster-binding NifX family protein